MSNIITIDKDSLRVVRRLEAEVQKVSVLRTAALVGKVTTPAEQDTAVAAQAELGAFIKLVEDSRVAVKEGPWQLCKEIDAYAKSLSEEVKEERTRIAALVGDFQSLEAAKVRAAEAAKRLDEERLEAERRAEERRIFEEEAEKKRKFDAQEIIAMAAASEARDNAERQAAETQRLELERQRALAAAETHAQLDAANERHAEQVAALPTVTAARAEGQAVRWDWDITVHDIWALAGSHRLCVRIEPRLNEIKSLLEAGVRVAGVSAKKIPKSSVRLGGQKFIDIGAREADVSIP